MERERNGKRVILSEQTFEKITETLSWLVAKTQARTALFCDVNGHLIAQRGETVGYDPHALSAVAAGEFSATSELAKMIGQSDGFVYLYHEGPESNVYISRVNPDFFLVVVFDHAVALGMVRVFTRKAIESLAPALKPVEEEKASQEAFLDLEFSTLLGRQLDQSLGI
ncbi:MAG: roadblock/LC7 domain-containing protein [candidate division KSB1 bacterium]|nr:roadblock/LC7 domain-containing protein [candidate division KSB1 bacterium]